MSVSPGLPCALPAPADGTAEGRQVLHGQPQVGHRFHSAARSANARATGLQHRAPAHNEALLEARPPDDAGGESGAARHGQWLSGSTCSKITGDGGGKRATRRATEATGHTTTTASALDCATHAEPWGLSDVPCSKVELTETRAPFGLWSAADRRSTIDDCTY